MAHIDIHSTREAAEGGTLSTCACGGHDETLPELDVQTIPHAIRHGAIFGALDGLRPGSGMIISATHDPVPLLQQLSARSPEQFDVEYVEAGPERWRLRFTRRAAASL